MEKIELFEPEQSSQGEVFRLQNNVVFQLPRWGNFNTLPREELLKAATVFNQTAVKISAINRDGRYSDLGKAEQIEPVVTRLIEQVANAADFIDACEIGAAKIEADLYRPPLAQNTLEFAWDGEVRTTLRSMSAEDRRLLIQSLQADPAGNKSVILALMRGPLRGYDPFSKAIEAIWRQTVEAEHPDTLLHIADTRGAVDWARRGIYQLAPFSMKLSGWDSNKLLRYFAGPDGEKPRGGFQAFGFARSSIDQMAFRVKQERKVRA